MPTLFSFFLFYISINNFLISPVAKNINANVHMFMYLWYGTPDFDGEYKHWNHEVLPHWESRINEKYPTLIGKRHKPPEQLHSPFYPLRGPYSSKDKEILKTQFEEINIAGGSVAVVSWWGQSSKDYATDTQGVCTDLIIKTVLETAVDYGDDIKIAFHLEPYPSRSVESVLEDVSYIIAMYSNYSSFYRAPDGRPMFYVYDSYHIYPSQWSRMLHIDGDITVRGTPLDAWFVGLWLHQEHGRDLEEAGFDGIYTYFATDGFSFGSTSSNWHHICNFCHTKSMLCILSVGPGYNDSLIRPWNLHNARSRADGVYYESMWHTALEAGPTHVSITSYNEWGEGTQIEPARVIDKNDEFAVEFVDQYLNYGAEGPYKYLHITARYADQLQRIPQPFPVRIYEPMYTTAAIYYAADLDEAESLTLRLTDKGIVADL